MEDSTYIEQSFALEAINKTVFTLRRQPTSVFRICFRFCCLPVVCDWARYPGSPDQLLWQTHEPKIVTRVDLTLQQLLRIDNARHIITHELNDSSRMWDEVIDDALVRAREAVRDMPLSHNAVFFNVCADLYQHTVFDGERLIEEESLHAPCMVPASESSIVSVLRRKRKLAAMEENVFTDCCCICLDEFLDDEEVASMPCCHVFHGECIEKWLRTSHYCPVCRFEMPTESY